MRLIIHGFIKIVWERELNHLRDIGQTYQIYSPPLGRQNSPPLDERNLAGVNNLACSGNHSRIWEDADDKYPHKPPGPTTLLK